MSYRIARKTTKSNILTTKYIFLHLSNKVRQKIISTYFWHNLRALDLAEHLKVTCMLSSYSSYAPSTAPI
jgi:hypothetical protein